MRPLLPAASPRMKPRIAETIIQKMVGLQLIHRSCGILQGEP